MRIALLTHAITSCWNHGNAHFLRGVLRDLARRGHETVAIEPAEAWSRENLTADHGTAPVTAFHQAFPSIAVRRYDTPDEAVDALDGADLVLVHEWTDPAVVAAVGRARRTARFTLLFHDTHHRAVTDPEAIGAFDLDDYDGVLAFGAALAEVYRAQGWGRRVHVWHEAADIALFHPPEVESERRDLVFIGNWGDGERTRELDAFLFEPARRAGLTLDVHGVRYPTAALERLDAIGARYHGWVANLDVPAVFARHLATVHVPRAPYVAALPGIPTIRVFEALACGIPLACAAWPDAENLFRPGTDYLVAADTAQMTQNICMLRDDPDLRASLARHGLETVLARHTCAHRADELLAIAARYGIEALETTP